MNFDLSCLGKNEKKLLYIQNMRPVLNRDAFFSDETEGYRNPAEPDKFEDVTSAPGGVGVMTVLEVIRNSIECYKRQYGGV